MRILYVANHKQRWSNDDEGAIKYALERLGHTVITSPERGPSSIPRVDLVLFHHLRDLSVINSYRGIPRVCWCFDLIDSKACGAEDTTLHGRDNQRISWMAQIVSIYDLIFCTDGEWVGNTASGQYGEGVQALSNKFIWLTQGVDERRVKRYLPNKDVPSLLFTGAHRKCGVTRETWVTEMKITYGQEFLAIEGKVHGEKLGAMYAGAKIVLASDYPIASRYWSNRVYLVIGYGGFLLHPCTEGLTRLYEPGQGVIYYRNREELHWLIKKYLEDPTARQEAIAKGLEQTLRCNLYRHRVEYMLSVIKERLGLS